MGSTERSTSRLARLRHTKAKVNLRWAATLTRRDGGGTICWVLRPRRGFVVRSRWSEPDGGTAHENIKVGEVKIVRSGSMLTFNGSYPVVLDASVPALRGPAETTSPTGSSSATSGHDQEERITDGGGEVGNGGVPRNDEWERRQVLCPRWRSKFKGRTPADGSVIIPGRAVAASAGDDAVSSTVESSVSSTMESWGVAPIDSSRASSSLSAASESDDSVGAAKEGIPGDPPDDVSGFESEPDWSCPQCTLINTSSYLQCDACGCLQPSERPLRPAVFPPKSFMEDQAKQWSTTSEPPSPSGPSAGRGKRKRTPGIGNPCRGEGSAAQSAVAASTVRPASPCVRVPVASALSSRSPGGASSCGVPGVKTATQKGQRATADRGRDAVVPPSRATAAGTTRKFAIGKKSGTRRTAVASAEHQTPPRTSKLPARKSAKIESPAVEKRRRSTSAATTAALRRRDSPRGDRELGRGGAAVPRSRATSAGADATKKGATGAPPPAKFDIRPAAAEATSVAAERQIPAWALNYPLLSSMMRAGKPPASSEGVIKDRGGKETSVETVAEQRRSRVTSGGVERRRAELDDAVDASFLPRDASVEKGLCVFAANGTVAEMETELVESSAGEVFNAPFMNTPRVSGPLASSSRPDSLDTTSAPTEAGGEAGGEVDSEAGGEVDSEAEGDGSGGTEIEHAESLSGDDTDAEFQGQEQKNGEVEHDNCWGDDDDCRSDISQDY